MRSQNLGSALNGKKLIILFDSIEDYEKIEADEFLESLERIEEQIRARKIHTERVVVRDSVEEALKDFDPNDVVIFNWCERFNFEDKLIHKVPEELDRLGYVYTGCNSEALQVTQNKMLTKQLLVKNKVPVPAYKIYKRGGEFLKNWNIFPAMVKPVEEHCSNGITKDSVVDNYEQLVERVDYVLKNFDGAVMIEEFVDGPEFMVGLWGSSSDNVEVLPIVQLDYSAVTDYHDSIYSFDAKWNPASDVYSAIKQICPPEIDKELLERVETAAINAFNSTKCSNYGRLEIRVKNGIPYVLDVNSNPDMMGPNEFILSANKVGYTHGDIFIKLCELALAASVSVPSMPITISSGRAKSSNA